MLNPQTGHFCGPILVVQVRTLFFHGSGGLLNQRLLHKLPLIIFQLLRIKQKGLDGEAHVHISISIPHEPTKSGLRSASVTKRAVRNCQENTLGNKTRFIASEMNPDVKGVAYKLPTAMPTRPLWLPAIHLQSDHLSATVRAECERQHQVMIDVPGFVVKAQDCRADEPRHDF